MKRTIKRLVLHVNSSTKSSVSPPGAARLQRGALAVDGQEQKQQDETRLLLEGVCV